MHARLEVSETVTLSISTPMTDISDVFVVAMVSGSLQERARSAEERSLAPPGGEPAKRQHRRLRPDHLAALLLLHNHQTGR